jgi:hypothetical protein
VQERERGTGTAGDIAILGAIDTYGFKACCWG